MTTANFLIRKPDGGFGTESIDLVSRDFETQPMTLGPLESKNFQGHCTLEVHEGSVEVSNPAGNVYFENGELNSLVLTLTAGENGCTFTLKRPFL